MIKKMFLMLVIFVLFLAGCNMPHISDGNNYDSGFTGSQNGQGDMENAPIEINNDIFNPDPSAENNNTYKFVVAESYYLTEYGYTLWAEKYENTSESFEPFSVKMYKESGRAEAGYGIIFCSQKIDGVPYLLTVLINEQGMYSIGKVKNGVFSFIENWKSAGSIRTGAGVNNTVSIEYDAVEAKFKLQINGIDVTTFVVSEPIVFRGSKKGFVAVIADNEQFPANPVKVTYEKM